MQKNGAPGQIEAFKDLPVQREPTPVDPRVGGAPPEWSVVKSRLIADYLKNFLYVTKGGFYLDGFAGPQRQGHEELWTAKRVLEIENSRLSRHWLCEIDAEGIRKLRALKNVYDRRGSRVDVFPGDFNKTIDVILGLGRIKRRTPVIAFLDQRTAECHWRTVKKIAGFRRKNKIEIIYFFGTGWINRSLKSSSRDERKAQLDAWWGRSTWNLEVMSKKPIEQAEHVRDRFRQELGYQFVQSFPVYKNDKSARLQFHLIHASSDPRANPLMVRSYRKICGPRANSPADTQAAFDF